MLSRSAFSLARRSAAAAASKPCTTTRAFTVGVRRRTDKGSEADPMPGEPSKHVKMLDEIRTMEDLLPPGAPPGPTMPTDLEQSTGLERLEILGKMQGIDIFDMRPLDASRLGTLDDPILVRSAGNEQFAGCTGFPADSHGTKWLGMSRARPMNRCCECGSVYMLEYVGPPDDHASHDDHHGDDHGHHHVNPLEEKWEDVDTFAEYVKPEYKGVPPGFKNGHML